MEIIYAIIGLLGGGVLSYFIWDKALKSKKMKIVTEAEAEGEVIKKDKILQLGERVWGILVGSDDVRIDQTIQKMIEFFESVGIPTRLPYYNVPTETIDTICTRFKRRGFKVGEKANIGPEEIRLILEDRL